MLEKKERKIVSEKKNHKWINHSSPCEGLKIVGVMNGAVILSMIHTYLFVNKANNNLDVSENGVFNIPQTRGDAFYPLFFLLSTHLLPCFPPKFFFSGS